MHILGGDLAPARRRQYGGGYGRKRRRRTLRVILAVLLVIAGAGAAYFLLNREQPAPARVTKKPCPTPSVVAPAVVAVPRPQQVRLALLNGTPRNGLAKAIGNRLVAQGFVVLSQGNAPAPLNGPSQVTFGPGAEPAATVLSHWVVGSTVAAAPRARAGSVSVTLGSSFTRLSTPAEVAALQRAAAGPVPSATATAC